MAAFKSEVQKGQQAAKSKDYKLDRTICGPNVSTPCLRNALVKAGYLNSEPSQASAQLTGALVTLPAQLEKICWVNVVETGVKHAAISKPGTILVYENEIGSAQLFVTDSAKLGVRQPDYISAAIENPVSTLELRKRTKGFKLSAVLIAPDVYEILEDGGDSIANPQNVGNGTSTKLKTILSSCSKN